MRYLSAGSHTVQMPIVGGRGNDFATVVGVPREPEAALRAAVEGPIRRVDCGRAGDVAYVVHCGVGFDSEAARWANDRASTSSCGGSARTPRATS